MTDSTRIYELEERIFHLNYKVDSISNFADLKVIEYKISEHQNVLSEVNQFYDSAWLKLIVVISVLGIVLPILVQILQGRNLKNLTKLIQN